MERLFSKFKDIEKVYEICGEWEFDLKGQKIKVRVKKDFQGYSFETNKVFFENIHQFSKRRSLPLIYETKEDALKNAILEFESVSNKDEEGFWIKNRDYYN